MVFKQWKTDIGSLNQLFKQFGTNYGLFNKTFSDIGKDFKNGLGLRSFTNFVSKTDVENFNNFNNALRNGDKFSVAFRNNLSKSSTVIQKQAVSIAKLYNQQKILNNQYNAGKITQQEYNTAMTANKAKMQALTTQTQTLTLAQRASVAASKALAVGLNLIGNIAFMATISLIITGITKLVNKQEELRQKIEENAQTAKEQTDNIKDLISAYEEFADKTSYTAEEKDKLKALQEQLIETYHGEAEGIDLVNGKYDEEIEKLREISKEKLKDANRNLTVARNEAAKNTENSSFVGNDVNKIIRFSADSFADGDYQKIVQDLKEVGVNLSDDIGLFWKQWYDGAISFTSGNAEWRANEVRKTMEVLEKYGYTSLSYYSELNALLKEYQDRIDDENIAVTNLAENMFSIYDTENHIKDVGKESYLAWRDGLLSQAGDDSKLRNELLSLIKKQFPDYDTYFANLYKARQMFTSHANSPSDGKIASERDSFLLTLSDDDLEIATQIPDLFANGLDGAAKKIEEFKANPDNVIEAETDTSSLDELKKAYEELSKSADSFVKNKKSITSALEEQEKHGQLSASTIKELSEAGYGEALVTDTVTGAVTLNREAYEKLNEQKKLKIRLDLQNEQSDLESKLKDEETAVSELRQEYEALAKADMESNAGRLSEITLELAKRGENIENISALISQINGDITSLDAPTFDNDNTDSWKDEAENKIKEIQHLETMNQITHEEYISRLEAINQKYYANNAKYLDDFNKYEEEVYKYRLEREQDLFDKKIDNYEKLADKALDKYVDGDGNELTVNASFDYAREQINAAIAETQNRIDELSMKTGFDDEIDSLRSDLEGLYDTLADINKQEIESQKEYISSLKDEYSDLMDEQIEAQKKLADETEKSYESRISAIDKQIDAVNKVNEAEERQKKILEAQKELREASIKNRIVLTDNGWEARADDEAVKEAQENLKNAYEDEQIARLEEQKELLETQKDESKAYYDKIVNDLENQKTAREKQYDILVDIYEKLGGEKKQTSLNDGLVSKLTKSGDINKAVQGLSPNEMKQAITSGLLTTDSKGNYTIDYSVLDNNSAAVKDNTTALNDVNDTLNKFIPETAKTDNANADGTVTAGGFTLVADEEGKLTKKPVEVNGKVAEGLGQKINPVTKSEWESKNDMVKSVGDFAGFDSMQSLLKAMLNGSYTLPASFANQMMNNNVQMGIGKDILSGNLANSAVYNNNNNNAPTFIVNNNVQGDMSQQTADYVNNKITENLTEYTDQLYNSLHNSFIRQKNKI